MADRIAATGRMVFDLEFVSEDRYIPELSLLQVAWGNEQEPDIALIDCVAADPAPILALIASDQIETVAHSARQDLGLLAVRFGIHARAFWDTQIAAAFLGIAEQVGYARLVEQLLGVQLDKGAQYTAWLERPLSARQLRYAADDVRYLPRVWALLQGRLAALGRLSWVGEESARLAEQAMPYGPAEQAYRDIKGWRTLRGRALGALRGLAAWRQEQALAENKPPSWLLTEPAMVELCKRGAASVRELRAVRSISGSTVQSYGDAILARMAEGARGELPAAEPPEPALSNRAQMWAAVIAALIQARCAGAGIAPRYVGTRADAEALALWFELGPHEREPALALLSGWRRELAGEAVLAWLHGKLALVPARDREDALALIEPAREPVAGPERQPGS